jgi:adenosylcobinamide amidohydrolase
MVDHRNKYLRVPFEHQGHPCAFAATHAYNMTYSLNSLRDLASNTDDNLYPYSYGYNFYNGGSSSGMCCDIVEGFKIAIATGIPNNTTVGGFTSCISNCKWINGYDKYYLAMHNRAQEYNFFDLKVTTELPKLKQWIYDQASGVKDGGLANFNVNSSGIKTKTMTSGTASGKILITGFGTSSYDHSLTIVGYDDGAGYDYNDDGQITNDVDINRDGQVDNQDSELGAFIIINSHVIWNAGFAYASYKLFSISNSQGGIGRNNQVYYMKVFKDFAPKYTLKTTITCASRNQLKIYAGIAPDQNATQPTKIKGYAGAFNYAGGSLPMEGQGLSSTIEIGLDVSDLVDSIGKVGAFFLCIDSKSGAAGTVAKLSLMDYTGTTVKEYPYKDQNVAISGNLKLGGIMPATGINTPQTSHKAGALLITPNPVMQGKNISVSIPPTGYSHARIILYNLTGRMVLQKQVEGSHASRVYLSTASLASGVYKAVVLVRKQTIEEKRYYGTINVIK